MTSGSMHPDFDPLTKHVLDGIKLGVFEDDLGKALLENWRHKIFDDDMSGMITNRVQSGKLREALRDDPFRTPKLTTGDIQLGSGSDGQDIRIPLNSANAHTLVIANSGAGKTTRARMMAFQMATLVPGMWLFDLRKREFRILVPILQRAGIPLQVVPARSCKINPIQTPRGVDPRAWASTVGDLLAGVLCLQQRSAKLVHRHIIKLQRKHGVLDGGHRHPTCFDLFDSIKLDKQANPQARHAVLDALEPVLLSLGPEVLAYEQGWHTNELAKKPLIFEFGDVTETDKNLLLNTLIIGEFSRRIAAGYSNIPMDLWICCDEGQRMCGGTLDDLIGLVRGAGLGLDLSVLTPHGVSPQILANTSIKVLGRCGHLGDYIAAGKCLGLNQEQIRWAQMNLGPGKFVVSVGEGSWRNPCIVNLPEPMWPEAAADIPMNPLSDLEVIPAQRNQGSRQKANGESCEKQADHVESDTRGILSDDERRFCVAVRDNPLSPASRMAKLAKMNATKAVRIRQALIKRELLRQHTLETGGRGRAATLLELTPTGHQALDATTSSPEE